MNAKEVDEFFGVLERIADALEGIGESLSEISTTHTFLVTAKEEN